MDEDGRLSYKQRQFITEYLRDFNGTQAAIRAGYSVNGAHVQASRMLSTPKIKRELDRILAERQLSPGDIAHRLSELATVTVEDFFDFPGDLPLFNPEKAKKRGVLHLIDSIEYDAQRGVKIKFADRLKALELIGRYHGMFTDKTETANSGEVRLVVEFTDTNPKTQHS